MRSVFLEEGKVTHVPVTSGKNKPAALDTLHTTHIHKEFYIDSNVILFRFLNL